MDRVGRLQDTASVQKHTLIHSLFVALVFFFCFSVVRLRSYQKVTVEIMKSSRKTLREEKPTEEK